MCVRTHSPANGDSEKEKKNEGNREKEDSAPPSAAALILGGSTYVRGRGATVASKTGIP